MAQFVAFDPKVEISGAAILMLTSAMGEAVVPIMKSHLGANVLDPNGWYPVQAFLDMYNEINAPDYNAVFDLVKIGMKVPDVFPFPPEIDSIPAALQAIDVAYHMGQRNGEIGFYRAVVRSKNLIDVMCYNPSPCDGDYGIIYGVVQRFRPKNTTFTVYHDDASPCRKKGGDYCIYHVTWD